MRIDLPDSTMQTRDLSAKILIEIKDEEYGGRGYTCKDTEEYVWNFGSYDPWTENE